MCLRCAVAAAGCARERGNPQEVNYGVVEFGGRSFGLYKTAVSHSDPFVSTADLPADADCHPPVFSTFRIFSSILVGELLLRRIAEQVFCICYRSPCVLRCVCTVSDKKLTSWRFAHCCAAWDPTRRLLACGTASPSGAAAFCMCAAKKQDRVITS